MPIYAYVCEECGKKKEVLLSMKEHPEMICCNKLMKRKFGSLMLEFKGSGFHQTDYKRLENIHRDAREHVDREDPSLKIM